MKQHIPKHYNAFTCLASDCPDTCCAGWEVVLDEKSQSLYKNTSGEFGKRLQSAMILDEEGDIIFKSVFGRCPFLSSHNLCEIYSTLGESSLSETCRLYPRFFNHYGAFQEAGLSLSCPEAARLILDDPHPMSFMSTNSTITFSLEEKLDAKLLSRLLNARSAGIALLQNRSLAYPLRLGLLLDFIVRLTASLFTADPNTEAPLCSEYQRNVSLQNRLNDLKRNLPTPDTPLLKTVFQLLKSCEHRSVSFTHRIDTAISLIDSEPFTVSELWPISSTQSHYAEHLGVYTLFRYFLESVFTYEPLIHAQYTAFASLSTAVLAAAAQRQAGRVLTPVEHQKIIFSFSREIEHSIPNMARIEDSLVADERLSPNRWIAFLLLKQ
ncbi:flagellin lysine-N-methylase [Eubacterium limosum]|uniref:flagellin lysine-N-methylase n=1 Tax=Eubacterium limosum TaxID=1736 RepID=UPI0022E448EF|nr:flagellin lysine-N-methylase [Eubacterium limosum]